MTNTTTPKAASPVPKTVLGENVAMPMVGFGTYLIREGEAARAVKQALDVGYRHIDTAEAYRNEAAVGEALSAHFSAGHPRDEVFVTTKLWPGSAARRQTPKTYQTKIESLEASLARLNLAHVDLYLIHSPMSVEQRAEQWRALVALKQQGKVRAIGVSNFNEQHINEIVDATSTLPEANQIELHPWSQKPTLTAYLEAHHIQAIAYSSLVPLATWRTATGQSSAKTEQMRDAASTSPFAALAKKYRVTQAQILLRWGLQRGYPVLPKSIHPARMAENLDLFGFTLDDEDMQATAKLDRGDGVAWGAGDPTLLP